MKVVPYTYPANWFQIGWNTAIENPGICVVPLGLNSFDFYDFLAGYGAVMYKRSLPDTWLD